MTPTTSAQVAVADDDSDMLAVLTEMIESLGLCAVPATTGDELRAVIARDDVSLIVTDNEMPGRKGLDVVTELRAAGSTTPCVLVTGSAIRDATVDGIIVLRKPVRAHALCAAIAAALGR